MKIYTGTGDQGKTSLFSGERVAKNHERVEAYGDVDELSSVLGAVVAMLPESESEIAAEIQTIQANLLRIGALLASTPDSSATARLDPITEADILGLESAIDRMNAELPELRSFILPGGHVSSAMAHMARTVCRRSERHMIALQDSDASVSECSEHSLVFMNRLSDYLFVLARYCNHVSGVSDILWDT